MQAIEPNDTEAEPFVSTGQLPAAHLVTHWVNLAHVRFRGCDEGERSQVYPALSRVDPNAFGLCVAGLSGNLFPAGDATRGFALMSVSKPFVFALVCEALGTMEARRRLGVNATGRAFNSVGALDASADGRTNPMVNAGALATTSCAPGHNAEAQWRFLLDGLSRFAGRPLELHEEVYASARTTNQRNRGTAWLLEGLGRLGSAPETTTDLYTRQCALQVTAVDLALMGATLADGGVHPRTLVRVVGEDACAAALAVMTTAGLYEASGEWLYDVGVPGKSGIGGGIVAIAPGKGALGSYSPLLDPVGNSIRGVKAAQFLAAKLGLGLFRSRHR